MNSYELFEILESEDKTIDFCISLGLLPDKESGDCVNCGAQNSCLWKGDRKGNAIPFVIKCKICNKSHSILRNTWFEQSKTSIKNVVLVVYAFVRGLTLNQAASQTGVSRTTVMNWLNFCREVCYLCVSRKLKPIGGTNRVVEIDIMLVRKLKANSSKVWVFGGIDRESRECFAVITDKKNRDTILPLILKFILPGTKLISFKKKMYEGLEEFGFKSERVSKTISSEEDEKNQMFAIPGMWNELKKIIKNNGRDSSRNNELYIYQFLYFHNLNMNTAAQKFIPFLKDIGRAYPGYKYKPFAQEVKHE